MKLQMSHTNCLPRSSFFSVRVINDWNSLPQSVINASSANQFKNLLDRHILMYCQPLLMYTVYDLQAYAFIQLQLQFISGLHVMNHYLELASICCSCSLESSALREE